MVPTLLGCLLTFGLFVPAHAQQDLAALERAVAARPSDAESRRMLADGYSAAGRLLDAVAERRKVTDLAPKDPRSWYGLGQAYNAIKREALATFDDPREDEGRSHLAPWDLGVGSWELAVDYCSLTSST